jgi:hypothetical protein
MDLANMTEEEWQKFSDGIEHNNQKAESIIIEFLENESLASDPEAVDAFLEAIDRHRCGLMEAIKQGDEK